MTRENKETVPFFAVNRFWEIFEHIGLQPYFTGYNAYGQRWHSVTLHDATYANMVTSGKGESRRGAEESACGEFIERLQGEWLYKLPDLGKMSVSTKTAGDSVKNYIKAAFGRRREFEIRETKPYFDMIKHRVVCLPDDLIMVYSGDNGVASGTTKTEAFIQGLCEIFEHYVMKTIYRGIFEESDFPLLDKELYKNLDSYSLIQEIENLGYRCFIKDCTLHGQVPVIGMLIYDCHYNRYCFSLGSDLDLNHALQRCFVQILKKIDIGIRLKEQMHNKLEDKNYWDNDILDENGFARMLSDGAGKLPTWLLHTSCVKSSVPAPIGGEKLTPEESRIKLVQIVKNMNKQLFVKDCSFLGVPTLRVVVPGMSEIYYDGSSLDYLKITSEIFELLCKKRKMTCDLDELFCHMTTLFRSTRWKYECSWEKLYGPYFCVQLGGKPVDIYFLYAALCIRNGYYEWGAEYMKKSFMKHPEEKYRKFCDYAEIITYGYRDGRREEDICLVVGQSVEQCLLRHLLNVISCTENVNGGIDCSLMENVKMNEIYERMMEFFEKMKRGENYTDTLYQ